MDKKVIFLSRYQKDTQRGVETYVFELAKRLKAKYEVSILSRSDSDDLLKVLKSKPDIVVATNGRLQSLKMGLGRLFGKYKLVIPGQAGVGRDDAWNILICNPDVYVGLTDYETNWASRFALRSEIVKIPNGVDLDKFNPKGEKLNLKLKAPIVLSVGALFWYKHHEYTIKALKNLPNVSLLIVGSGPEEENLRRLAAKLLTEDMFKIESFKFEDMPKIYRSCDLFVLPSWIRESFGIAYVEAMASGLAVVAPDDEPRREVIGSGGLLTDVTDSKKYSEAIRHALEAEWGNIPRKQAEKFSWVQITKQYEDLFEELLK